MNQPSILVIDDDPTNFDVIEALLYDQGYQFYFASSGQDALNQLDLYNPDLILLDVMMPEINGVAVCQQIRSRPEWHSVPIVMVTALTAKADLAHCLDSGADDFISKPVNPLELQARVRSMLRVKEQFDKLQAFTRLQRDTINVLGNSLEEFRGGATAFPSPDSDLPRERLLQELGVLLSSLEAFPQEASLQRPVTAPQPA